MKMSGSKDENPTALIEFEYVVYVKDVYLILLLLGMTRMFAVKCWKKSTYYDPKMFIYLRWYWFMVVAVCTSCVLC